MQDSSQEDEKVVKGDTQYKEYRDDLGVDTLPRRRVLDPSWEGTSDKHSFLANEVACNNEHTALCHQTVSSE